MEIDIQNALMDKPRPHYLTGFAFVEREGNTYLLRAKAIFPTGTPQIDDRMRAAVPHVNIAEELYGVWSAVHVLCEQYGVRNTLARQIVVNQ